jgi:hypothetical protein
VLALVLEAQVAAVAVVVLLVLLVCQIQVAQAATVRQLRLLVHPKLSVAVVAAEPIQPLVRVVQAAVVQVR